MKYLFFLFLISPAAHAFNWNQVTVQSFQHNRGKMEAPRFHKEHGRADVYPGGHNLATRRAMDYAILKAERDPRLQSAMEAVYGETLTNLKGQDGFAFQKILWGNYSNEVQTMLDADSESEKVLAWFMSVSYSRRHNIVGEDGRHSVYWTKDTGYTSSNPIHSMLVTSSNPRDTQFTQEYSFRKMSEFVHGRLESAITALVNVNRAKKDGLYILEPSYFQSYRAVIRFLRTIRKAYTGANTHYKDSRYEYALRDLGSVFHTIQDSSVACTEAARSAKKNPAECVVGDGHGILEKIGNEWKVVSLSDGAWYARKDGKHAELDNLYQPENLATVEELVNGTLDKGVYGSFDPALPVGNILLDVALEVQNINERLAQTPAYTPLSEAETKSFLRLVGLAGDFAGKKFAREDSLSKEWKEQLDAAAKSAARRLAEKYILSRYAAKLRPMPPPPTEVGEQKAHGEKGE